MKSAMKFVQAAVLVLCWSHIALGHKAKMNQDLSRLSVPVRLPPVPPVKDAGADGLPELPKVEALATMFYKEQSNINSEAKMFVGRLRSVQMVEKTKLGQLKSAYDQKLKSQEKVNQGLVKSNVVLEKKVIAQSKANDKIKAEMKRLDRRIAARRRQLEALEERFSDGRNFMKSALSTTDDTKEMSMIDLTGPKAPKSFLEVNSTSNEHEEPEEEREQKPEAQGVQRTEAEGKEVSENTPMSFLELDLESQMRSLAPKKSKAHPHMHSAFIQHAKAEPGAPDEWDPAVEALGEDPTEEIKKSTHATESEDEDPEHSASSEVGADPQEKEAAPEEKVKEAASEEKAKEAAPEEHASTPALADKSKDDEDEAIDASLVKLFSDNLHKMREGARKGKAALKSTFQSDYREGVVRHKALQEQQKLLESSLKALKAKSEQLQKAEAGLKKKLAALEKTLAKEGAFLSGLSRVANAGVRDAHEPVKNEVATSPNDPLSQ